MSSSSSLITFTNVSLESAALYRRIDLMANLLESGVDVHSYTKTPPIINAVKSGKASAITLLQKYGANVSQADQQGLTPLHWAAKQKNALIVTLLVTHGASVHATDDCGRTPLHHAAENGNEHAIALLIRHGADVDCVSTDGTTALSLATNAGHVNVVKFLIRMKANVHMTDTRGYNALHTAFVHAGGLSNTYRESAVQNCAKIVPILAMAGIDVNQKTKAGVSPIQLAIRYEHLTAAKRLFAFGARIDCLIEDDALHTATMHGDLDVVKLLVAFGISVNSTHGRCSIDGVVIMTSPLRNACADRFWHLASFLIDNGADPNIIDSFGNSALFYTVRRGNVEIAAKILDKGGDIHHVDEYNNGVLYHACLENDLAMVKLLLKRGANVNPVNCRSENPIFATTDNTTDTICKLLLQAGPLHGAVAQRDSLKLCALLVANGADVNHRTENGTPLHMAVERGRAECVDFLLRNGAIVDAVNSNQQTPLYIAAAAYDPRPVIARMLILADANVNYVIKRLQTTVLHASQKSTSSRTGEILLYNGAHINARDILGNTPLHYAVQSTSAQHFGDVAMLLKYNADVNQRNNARETPLQLALQRPHIGNVATLLENNARIDWHLCDDLQKIVLRDANVVPVLHEAFEETIPKHVYNTIGSALRKHEHCQLVSLELLLAHLHLPLLVVYKIYCTLPLRLQHHLVKQHRAWNLLKALKSHRPMHA